MEDHVRDCLEQVDRGKDIDHVTDGNVSGMNGRAAGTDEPNNGRILLPAVRAIVEKELDG